MDDVTAMLMSDEAESRRRKINMLWHQLAEEIGPELLIYQHEEYPYYSEKANESKRP